MKSLGTVVVALAMAGAAWADDELPLTLNDAEREARLLALEARVRELEFQQSDEEAIRKLREQAAKEKQEEMQGLPERVSKIEKGMSAAGQTWDASKMLAFSTPDGNFTAKIGGRIYVVAMHRFGLDDDYGTAGNNAGDLRRDQFVIDTARLQLDGTFYKDFVYRLEYAVEKNGAGNINNDVWIGWKGLPWLYVQAGQFKVPFSQEETTSSRFIDFAERSLVNRLSPGRDGGLLFSGTFSDKMFEWALGVFNGSGKNVSDTNDEFDVAARLMVTPISGLRLGIDVTVGDQDGPTALAAISAGDVFPDTILPAAAPAILDGLRTRYAFNFSWLYGPFSLRAEYVVVDQELIETATESDFQITGWYAQATWLITGETKPLENRVKPANNFHPLQGKWGAFELAARIAQLDTSDGEDAGVVAVGANQEAQQITIGLNWWWSPNVALRINYEMLSFDEDLGGLKTGEEDDDKLDVFYVRWQIDF